MGLDEINISTFKNAYVIYLGHHGDKAATTPTGS